ncbi:MAG: hypothetical protein ACSLFD_10425 [Solirubrobacterales bacterium]
MAPARPHDPEDDPVLEEGDLLPADQREEPRREGTGALFLFSIAAAVYFAVGTS